MSLFLASIAVLLSPEMGRYYCGHCCRFLSKTLFYQHKRLYYDRLSKKWSSIPVAYSELEAEEVSGDAFSLSHSESELEDFDDAFEAEDNETPCNDGKSVNSIDKVRI